MKAEQGLSSACRTWLNKMKQAWRKTMTENIVLIVEDDKSLGTALSDTLELAGMQTIHVTDGQAALNILANQNEWEQAQKWYGQFKNKFFYDKQLHVNSLQKMGIIQRLEEGK